MKPYAHILVPVDLGDQSKRILEHARTIADRCGSAIDLLYCFPNPAFPDATGLVNPFSPDIIEKARVEAEQELRAMLTPKEREHYHTKALAIVGDPLDGIVEYAKREGIDLIVMGTHGRKGLAHMFLGSVAERVIRTAPCPVLTVH
jgi:nucleotide-binding universal stress UspA family protein